MHVEHLGGSKAAENAESWRASVVVLVLDEHTSPVRNATVSGAWSGGTWGTSSCLTEDTGLCTYRSDAIPASAASVTFTVTDLAHSSLAYDPDQDVVTRITVRRNAPLNQAPQASFAYSCEGLTCAFDARGSADLDGAIVGYAWDFGDGQAGSGVVLDHAYASDAVHTVALTVTDDGGATSTAIQTVPVREELYIIHLPAVYVGWNRVP
jgi:PKD repeat protein